MRKQTIEGSSIPKFFVNLNSEVCDQLLDKLYLILGMNFLKLGLRKKDREVTRKLQLYKEWSKKFTNNRIK